MARAKTTPGTSESERKSRDEEFVPGPQDETSAADDSEFEDDNDADEEDDDETEEDDNSSM